ncbi:peptidoglycan editing factor PgeF [Sphingomicrobium clamense]|uniref:Purine nucleoside phosphorylase n=1 Tax=Sphingomicrobium clamense TaxID=2851013 RepID=A0ABS6V3T8_9SPHN|nr:peptidoglycan editing factor PgeF [Sphingomicrobium sp. B8]MBW0144213.1 peptidoglycan editing factor PgeF [Sphingomicrobium sp. B8]
MTLDITHAPTLSVPHGFFGRAGGQSEGAVAGLNCGFGAEDDPNAVRANRRMAADALIEGAPLASVHQIHSAEAVIATEPWPIEERPHADAVATATPGLLLGIVTADCAPILFADEEAGVVAATHAGWRGALAGVTDAAIGAMLSLGAKVERIHAAVGPCLAQRNFEVGFDFPEPLLAEDPDNERFFVEGPSGQPHFDLEAYVAARLAAAGIGRVWTAGLDTYAHPDRFYSYRRATHEGASTYGRQISMIGLARANG